MRALIFALVLVLAGIVLAGRSDLFPRLDSVADPDVLPFVLGSLLFVLMVIPVIVSYRGRYLAAARDLLAWAGFAAILVAGYSYRNELSGLYYRITGELMPPGTAQHIEATPGGERSVRIRKRQDGHFAVNAMVNGSSVTLMVDTGASTVVLRQADAKQFGADISKLAYNIPVQTANGVAFAARIRIASIVIGSIRVENVEALVARPGVLRESLLGMSFLSRLRSYEFSGDFLTFRG